MKQAVCKLITVAMLGSAAPTLLAADTGALVRGVVQVGASYRGDPLRVATNAQGRPVHIDGVGKLQLGLGAEWTAGQLPLTVRLLLSHDIDKSARVDDGPRASFVRTPLEATAYYTGLDGIRFGVSLGYVFSPTADVTVDGQERSVNFKNAMSKAFEIGYRFHPNLWGSLRLSAATYQPKVAGGVKSDVTHLAVSMAYSF